MTSLQDLQQVFNTVFENCPTLTEQTQKTDIENWDSIGHLNLILELEAQFGKTFTVENIEKMKDVSSILNYLNN